MWLPAQGHMGTKQTSGGPTCDGTCLSFAVTLYGPPVAGSTGEQGLGKSSSSQGHRHLTTCSELCIRTLTECSILIYFRLLVASLNSHHKVFSCQGNCTICFHIWQGEQNTKQSSSQWPHVTLLVTLACPHQHLVCLKTRFLLCSGDDITSGCVLFSSMCLMDRHVPALTELMALWSGQDVSGCSQSHVRVLLCSCCVSGNVQVWEPKGAQ